jgi:hypothetical protein
MSGGGNKVSRLANRAKGAVDNQLIAGDVAVVKRRIPSLDTARKVRKEMTYVYRSIWRGDIDTVTAGRLIAMLREVVNGIKVEAELEMLQQGYADAWTGIALKGPQQLPSMLPSPAKGDGNG